MRSVDVQIGPVSAAGIYYADCSGMALNTLALAFTGTATAAVEAQVGDGTWLELTNLEAGSSNVFTSFEYSLGQIRLNVSAYTSGTVKLNVHGLRG